MNYVYRLFWRSFAKIFTMIHDKGLLVFIFSLISRFTFFDQHISSCEWDYVIHSDVTSLWSFISKTIFLTEIKLIILLFVHVRSLTVFMVYMFCPELAPSGWFFRVDSIGNIGVYSDNIVNYIGKEKITLNRRKNRLSGISRYNITFIWMMFLFTIFSFPFLPF